VQIQGIVTELISIKFLYLKLNFKIVLAAIMDFLRNEI